MGPEDERAARAASLVRARACVPNGNEMSATSRTMSNVLERIDAFDRGSTRSTNDGERTHKKRIRKHRLDERDDSRDASRLRQPETALDGVRPLGVPRLPGRRVRRGLEQRTVFVSVVRNVREDVLFAPQPGADAGGERGAQSRGLDVRRARNRQPQRVRLDLHEQPVGARAAVHAQTPHRARAFTGGARGVVGVGAHRVQNVHRLETHRVKQSAAYVRRTRVLREPHDDAARVRAPSRREQAGERGHEHHVARVRHRARLGLDLRRGAYDSHVIAQPLHAGAGDSHRALQRVRRTRAGAETPAHRGQEPPVRGHGRARPGVEHRETPRAVRVLGLAGRAPLAERRRVLVADGCGDGDARQRSLGDLPKRLRLRAGDDLGQNFERHAEL
mmetsp:Transcript_6867/g.28091  ORF Transcript_6867/g.28091 Transcript_6867/m.28091 type:complete len:389 (+) Transcript_6867:2035-3201(+)